MTRHRISSALARVPQPAAPATVKVTMAKPRPVALAKHAASLATPLRVWQFPHTRKLVKALGKMTEDANEEDRTADGYRVFLGWYYGENSITLLEAPEAVALEIATRAGMTERDLRVTDRGFWEACEACCHEAGADAPLEEV